MIAGGRVSGAETLWNAKRLTRGGGPAISIVAQSTLTSRSPIGHCSTIARRSTIHGGFETNCRFWLRCNVSGRRSKVECDTVRVLVIDDFDSSLHPEAVEHLVNKHIHSGLSTQIIFTTHDTHLMSTRLMRRDQFWLTDRNSSGATRLRSIHSFEAREAEDLEKRYFEGRYRGLPIRRGE